MAESPAHRFGQIVGNLLEEILLPVLLKFCEERQLYLDRHGSRVGVRSGQRVSWEDKYGNVHNLDFVIEKGGSAAKRGRPVAFIEAAWRRYTKHSRSKAQEIQGAILPIAEKYERDAPFLGVVLAGLFTAPSIEQLKSLNFEVVHLSYPSIVAAFKNAGIDVQFDDQTPDSDFAACIKAFDALPTRKREALKENLFATNRSGFEMFFKTLERKLDRLVERVAILPLFGEEAQFSSVSEGLNFLKAFEKRGASGKFQKYEILVAYSNRDEVRGTFSSKENAAEFLLYMSRH